MNAPARTGLASLLLLSLCSSCATPPGKASDDKSVAGFYPLAVGNSWTYQVEGRNQPVTVQIVAKEGAWFVDDHGSRLHLDRDGIRDSTHYLLRSPVQKGKTWSAVEDLTVEQFEIEDADAPLKTPAGDFQHCAVVKNRQPLPSGEGKLVTVWTFAPGVGIASIQTLVEQKGRTIPQTRLTLVSYHLAR